MTTHHKITYISDVKQVVKSLTTYKSNKGHKNNQTKQKMIIFSKVIRETRAHVLTMYGSLP